MAESCPECGADLVPTTSEDVMMCIQCGWSGDIGEAVPDTSPPLDVRTSQGEVVFEVKVRQGRRTEAKNIRLSPDGTRRFAEALSQAADDAERRDDRGGDGDGGGKPRPPGGKQG